MTWFYGRDGAVVRASASHSVDLGFNLLVEFKNGIHSFPCFALCIKKG